MSQCLNQAKPGAKFQCSTALQGSGNEGKEKWGERGWESCTRGHITELATVSWRNKAGHLTMGNVAAQNIVCVNSPQKGGVEREFMCQFLSISPIIDCSSSQAKTSNLHSWYIQLLVKPALISCGVVLIRAWKWHSELDSSLVDFRQWRPIGLTYRWSLQGQLCKSRG